MGDDRLIGDGKLLSAISTSVEAIRIVGAQEVSQNLLRHPRAHQSAGVIRADASCVLQEPGSMTASEAKQEAERQASWQKHKTFVSLLAMWIVIQASWSRGVGKKCRGARWMMKLLAQREDLKLTWRARICIGL
eukprot:Plantae.Rhodophyta-Hildenbrandia_rubra.ctg9539.p1 GENE.Plantae.Rhodophyta-Hildenbrandia_rubra.ctg9539~~Plantae.Rhodophyta-Hildenbrandia_rubra.ctg9539.p1  ORF type:complete len:134 (-),score=16.06 Plantae.Rhodophyta-Hildenbrandia_rubra.ctg9539:1671-2072(-)